MNPDPRDDAMIMTGCRVRAVDVPLKRPVRAKVGSFDRWAFICVDVETKGGITGRGYITPYLANFAPVVAETVRTLAKRFEGRAIAPAAFFDEGMKAISLLGKNGIALYALAALDIAFWDARAQRAGEPLAVHLGGSLGPVRAYNSNGLWLASPPGELATEAEALAAEGGFSAVKLRIGRDSLSEDLAAIAAVRKGAGEAVAVLSDFNQGLTFGAAMTRLPALDDAGLGWFEEPIAYDDYDNCAELARALRTPVIIGENFHGPRDLLTAAQRRAADKVMPDLMRIGGVTGWLRAAALAAEYGLELSSHIMPEVSAHLLRVSPTAEYLEWTDWACPILAEPFALKDGCLEIPDVPGNGLSWNEEALEAYAIRT
jgi:mandelate racemase